MGSLMEQLKGGRGSRPKARGTSRGKSSKRGARPVVKKAGRGR